MTAEEEANIDWSLTTWKGSRLQQHRESTGFRFVGNLRSSKASARSPESFKSSANAKIFLTFPSRQASAFAGQRCENIHRHRQRRERTKSIPGYGIIYF